MKFDKSVVYHLRAGEEFLVRGVLVRVLSIQDHHITLGFEGPRTIEIKRRELLQPNRARCQRSSHGATRCS